MFEKPQDTPTLYLSLQLQDNIHCGQIPLQQPQRELPLYIAFYNCFITKENSHGWFITN